ncbi:MAG TPA: winged helix-turn-helix domain-containing protein [Gemmatimonadaceae bacterium]
MPNTTQFAEIASLLGEASRSRMLAALMDGRALTATELALESDVSPSTASSHLTKLVTAGLVEMTKRGRHRYFRISGPEVASVIESLSILSAHVGRSAVRTGPNDAALRRARVCYDHLAGEYAVSLLSRMRSRGFITGPEPVPALTGKGVKWLETFGVDVDALSTRRRPLCLACLDWSERRTHLAGAVGAALLERLFALRLVRRETGTRTLHFSPRGERFLELLEIR